MKHILIIVSTRDYPFNEERAGYTRVDDSPLNDVFKNLKLDEEVIKQIKDERPEESEKTILLQQRNLFWVNYEKGSWFDYSTSTNQSWYGDYMLNRSPIFTITLNKNDITFHIYVGPCTNEQRNLTQKRAYTEGLISCALSYFRSNNEYEKIDKIIAIVHGPDIIESGQGAVSSENLSLERNQAYDEPCKPTGEVYKSYKDILSIARYQHDTSDSIYQLIVSPIVKNNLTFANCEKIYKEYGEQKAENLSSMLIKSYKEILFEYKHI